MNNFLKLFFSCAALLLAACTTDSGESSVVDDFDASIVCPAEGTNAYGQEYKYTTIGEQVWMAENLNYNAVGSICQGKDESKCELYGRLYRYTWPDRNTGRDTINWDFIDSVCPPGWHLPKLAEWEKLQGSVGEEGKIAALRLKSVKGWERSHWGAGVDECEFSVLPAGTFTYQSSCEGNSAEFLTATAANETMNYWYFFDEAMGAGYGPSYFTIRCIKD
ncbi:FISUMP domain-containing protein [Fibrobacter succinogenes]|uniref:FISUMP domain-containing protein n=1 Tax=Fibrobacter succinogenes TaxID=833 RepID=UPI0013D0CEE9|nr:FISUMP domain-containing protein [Fibrobacter succinogenes]